MPGEILVGCKEKFLLRKSGQALGNGLTGGSEVTIPGGVRELFRWCTEGRGLVGNIGGRWTVELDDLGDLFQLW